jgi:hypothetical protein
MRRSNFSVAIANLVMEAVSELQKARQSAALKDIKTHIFEKYGSRADKFMKLVPQYLSKGLSLGIIAKYGDHYRTKMFVSRRGKRRGGGRRRRRRRRKA